jgi:UDP-N-acetylmuramoyl-tripeptide--D-alanyl-D-alanine ligase
MRATFKSIVVLLLTLEARAVLWRYKPKIVAVTGSAGKTSTKDAIFEVLSGSGLFVRKSEKSFNSEIGVPLTILGCANASGSFGGWVRNLLYGLYLIAIKNPYPAWLVLEVGADRPGDIRRIARWLRPDIAVITSIPDIPVHVEFFHSPERVAKEKRQLAVHLRRNGRLIINGDDERTAHIHKEFKHLALSFGFGGHNDFDASHDEILFEGKKPVGMQFRANRSGSSVPVFIHGVLGKPPIYAALAGLAVAEALDIDLIRAAEALKKWVPPPGRMRILEGIRGSVILDDTYNSSPVAAFSALETLINIPGFKKRIAVLGDMLELGRYSAEAHKKIGKCVAEYADQLVTVGFRARAIAESAMDNGLSEKKIRQYEQDESRRAGKELEADLTEQTIVLVKGSQSMRMERTVKEIMADPEKAEALLVRQDPEWIKKK